MRKSRLWRGTALLTAACGLVAAGAATADAATAIVPAAASPAAGVTITIAAKSKLPRVSGHVLVVYLSPARTATISGSVRGAAKDDTATLLARRFGARKYTAAGRPVTLHPSGGKPAPYSFRVRPTLATRYKVQVRGHKLSPVTSAVRIVYVAARGAVTGRRACARPARPVCHLRFRLWVKIPASAYRTEAAKHWYLYSRLRLSRGRRPGLPRELRLNRSATASRARRLHSYEFVVTLRYKFRIGDHAYRWRADFCTRDSEARDGLGLPGHHGCGNKWVSAATAYLG